MTLNPPEQRSNFFSTDEYEDVVQSVDLVVQLLPSVSSKPWNWKWIVIALHSALQGTCVCALTQTDGLGAYKRDTEKQVRKALYDSSEQTDITEAYSPLIEGQIAPMPQLIKRVFGVDYYDLDAAVFETDDEQESSLRLLHALRKDFSHFAPQSWSIETAGLPEMVKHVCDIIEDVAFLRHVHRHNRFFDTDLKQRLEQLRGLPILKS